MKLTQTDTLLEQSPTRNLPLCYGLFVCFFGPFWHPFGLEEKKEARGLRVEEKESLSLFVVCCLLFVVVVCCLLLLLSTRKSVRKLMENISSSKVIHGSSITFRSSFLRDSFFIYIYSPFPEGELVELALEI